MRRPQQRAREPHIRTHHLPPWQEFHIRALSPVPSLKQDLATFGARIPCPECQAHYQQMVGAFPVPDDDSVVFSWSVFLHNQVNARLMKGAVGDQQALDALLAHLRALPARPPLTGPDGGVMPVDPAGDSAGEGVARPDRPVPYAPPPVPASYYQQLQALQQQYNPPPPPPPMQQQQYSGYNPMGAFAGWVGGGWSGYGAAAPGFSGYGWR